jgi:hypothetical protein
MEIHPEGGGALLPVKFLNFQSPLDSIGGAWPRQSIVSLEVAAATAALFFQPDALDGHNTVDCLAHVINGQSSDADRGQRFHFHAGSAKNADDGLDPQ